MKFFLYIAALVLITMSCSTTRNFSSAMEDDIYYIPGKKAMVMKEVENMTNQGTNGQAGISGTWTDEPSHSAGSTTPPETFSSQGSGTPVINRQT